MKDLKIYSADEVQDPLLLKLDHHADGGVMLEVVDLDGKGMNRGALLSITKDGFLHLYFGISKELELPLDEDGRLKLVDYEEKSAVTLSDDEMRSIFDLRDRLRKDLRMAIVLQDHDDLSTYLCVLEKMIEAFQLIDTPRTRGELNN